MDKGGGPARDEEEEDVAGFDQEGTGKGEREDLRLIFLRSVRQQ